MGGAAAVAALKGVKAVTSSDQLDALSRDMRLLQPTGTYLFHQNRVWVLDRELNDLRGTFRYPIGKKFETVASPADRR